MTRCATCSDYPVCLTSTMRKYQKKCVHGTANINGNNPTLKEAVTQWDTIDPAVMDSTDRDISWGVKMLLKYEEEKNDQV